MAVALEMRDGAEARIETGIGHVTKMDEPKGRNCHIEIAAEGLRLPMQGWVDTHNAELYNRVLEAHTSGRRIGYRIATKRKPGQDPTVPLEQIDRYQRVRDVEDVVFVGGAGAEVPASPAVAAPAAPNPPPGPSVPPEAPAGAPGASSGATAGDPSPPARASARVVDGKRGPRMAEAKPWEPYNSDGGRNLGSYEVQAALGTVLLAHDLLVARLRTQVANGALPPERATPSAGQVRALARSLLTAADRCQSKIRADHYVDRMDASHTRSRAAVRAALDAHPVPWGGDPEVIAAWVEALGDYGAVLLSQALVLLEAGEAAS